MLALSLILTHSLNGDRVEVSGKTSTTSKLHGEKQTFKKVQVSGVFSIKTCMKINFIA